MKSVVVILFLGVSALYCEEVTAQNMFPASAENSFSTRPPDSINNSTTTRTSVSMDDGELKIEDVQAENIDTTSLTNFGRTQVSSDVNWTNALSLEKLFADRTDEHLNKANSFAEDFRKRSESKFKDKNGNKIDNLNPETFNKEAIVENFEEESDTRSALAFQKELYDEMRAKLVVEGQIKCYITRKVNNSYYCPLPGMGTADFGGLAKDDQEEAQEKCNRECRQQVQCMEMQTNDSMGFSANGSHLLPIDWQTYTLNPEQVTKEFSFEYETANLSDVQDRYFEDGLVRGRITIKGEDAFGNEVTIFDGYVYRIKREGGKITLNIDKKLKEMKVYFFSSFIFDPIYMNEVSLFGENPEVTIKNISAGYNSNKRYFCPITQFEVDSAKCDGEIRFVTFGSATHSVCVPREDILPSSRSTIDGGYFRQNSCLGACWDKADCIPTYRHLSLDPNNLPEEMYDIEYGCVTDDGGDNQGCTQERCRAMFEEDVQPSKEIVWEKDDTRVTTVESGVRVADKARPRVDFQGELGAVGNPDKTDLFTEEMKDTAYQNMIKEESFNVSKDKLALPIPAKVAADVRVNSASSQISFNLLYKAPSFLYDDNKRIYLYPVIEVFSTYTPFKPISFGGQTYYPQDDDKIKAKDSVLLIQNQSTKQWTPFNRKMWQQYYLPSQSSSGEIIYRWFDTAANLRKKQDVFSTSTKEYVVYGSGYKTPLMDNLLVPVSGKPWEEYLLFPSLANVINKEGLFITNNSARDGKSYDFSETNDDRKAHYDGYRVYLVANEGTPLDLQSVGSRINADTLVYDSKRARDAKTAIEPDALYGDERVQLYLQGKPNKQSVFMKIKPNSTEIEHKGVIFMFLHE